jgi:hypothetical protein
VYVAFRRDRVGDPTAHVYRSTDYGTTWTRLVNGLPANEPVRVVREDAERRGLLYAGTETGVFVSYDNGARWSRFQGGFPVVPVTDLEVRHGDLIASTEGRAFWILDDLSVIRQRTDSVNSAAVHLYTPRNASLAGSEGGFGSPRNAGRNPAFGATVFYRLATAPDSTTPVTVEFLDARGTVLRSFASRGDSINRITPTAGLNRLAWNLRRPAPTRLAGIVLFGAPNDGARVPPGRYQARLTVGNTVLTRSFEVLQDPRLDVPAAVVAERDSLATLLSNRIGEIHDAVVRVRDLRTQVNGVVTRVAGAPGADTITKAGRALVKKLETMDPRLTTKATNGQDIINYANGINGQFGFLLGQVEGNASITRPVRERLLELERIWSALRAEVEQLETTEVQAFNALLQANRIPGVITPLKKPTVRAIS